MRSKNRLLKNWEIYAILDDGVFPDEVALEGKFRAIIKGGADVIQLRFKDIIQSSRQRLAARLVKEGRKHGIPVIINDRPEIALSLGAQGVHLGKGDISCGVARALLGDGAIIGRSGRCLRDIRLAEAEGSDYAAIGPVFATPLKPGIRPSTRFEMRKAVNSARIPVVAIGGINNDNVGALVKEGVRTVAFIRYGTTERATEKKIKALRRTIRRAKQKKEQ